MSKKRRAEKSGIDFAEEAVRLIRNAPAGALAAYYIGALPFTLCLLYFWSDMSRDAFAHHRLPGASLMLGILFLWMKCWQSAAAATLYAHVRQQSLKWTAVRILRMALVQTAIQPWGLIFRPIALLLTLPYGWTYAFFENVLVHGSGESAKPGQVIRRAIAQARLWPAQNHISLALLSGFGFFLWLNVYIAIAVVPWLLRTFFGIETAFTRTPAALFNTTLFAAACVCVYLLLNPLFKALYVLRCFYGDSVRSGEDLKLELTRVISAARAAVLIFALCMLAQTASAAAPAAGRLDNSASANRLDRSIDHVLARREFSWRMPRVKPPRAQRNVIVLFVEDALRTLRSWAKSTVRTITEWIEKVSNWLDRHWGGGPRERAPATRWTDSLRVILYVLVGLSAAIATWMIWRRLQQRQRQTPIYAEAILPVPDIAAEDTVATQLPEESWLELARQFLEKGDLRLALRAFYLAALAHLASRQMISVTRYKSDSDYERELWRRARGQSQLLAAFDENMRAFQRAWYGRHAVTPEALERVRQNLERIREC